MREEGSRYSLDHEALLFAPRAVLSNGITVYENNVNLDTIMQLFREMYRRFEMLRRVRVIAIVGSIALLAALAFAGYFTSDGWVTPTSGFANSTIFHYEVRYNLDEEQVPPNCYLKVWKGENLYINQLMAWQDFDDVVHYIYETTLPEGDDYTYQFETFDDYTLVGVGPEVI